MSVLVPYEKYKDSGVEWLGEVPEGWDVVKVAFQYEIQLGKMLQPDAKNNNDVEVEYLKAINVNWHGIQLNELNKMWANEKEIKTFAVNSGDLLVCEGGEAGRSCLYEGESEKYIIQNALHRVRPLNKNSNKFLYYVLLHCSSTNWFDVICNKATIVHFTVDKFSALHIPLPPLPEQQAIANYLDTQTKQIDTLVQEQKELIELLKEKRQALISHCVTKGLDPNAKMKDSGVEWLGEVPEGWGIVKLAHTTIKITNGYVGPTRDILRESGIGYLQSLHIKNGFIQFDGKYFVEPEWSKLHKKSILVENDVLIVQTGDIGQSAVVPKLYEGFNCHALIVVQTNSEILQGTFLARLLNSKYGRSFLLSIQTGSTLKHLNCGDVRNLMIPLPPLPEQQAIADHLDKETAKIDTLIGEAEETITLMQEHRSALISAVVTGKVKVPGVHP